VGYSELYDEWGYTWYPKDKPVSRFRLSGAGWYDNDSHGDLLGWAFRPAFGLDAILNSFVRLEGQIGEQLAIEKTFRYEQIHPTIELRPGQLLSFVSLTANLGDQIDYANDRLGHGGTVTLTSDIRPTTHLLLTLSGSRRQLNVTAEDGRSGRLFTADVARLRANYTFNSRMWVRVIEQYLHTVRDPSLYRSAGVDPEEGGLTSSVVFAYKLNWQTVLYLGYADNQELDERNDLQKSDRQAFFKVSYAFQR
jgi:hypothetical protein